MFKKNNNLRNQILELIAERQINRAIFPKKYCGMLYWSIGKSSFDEDRMHSAYQ